MPFLWAFAEAGRERCGDQTVTVYNKTDSAENQLRVRITTLFLIEYLRPQAHVARIFQRKKPGALGA